MKYERFSGLLVSIIALLVYANSLGNDFVWDDNNVILTNPVLLGSPAFLFNTIDATRDNELTPYYRPMALFTYLLEERVHGFNSIFMHLVNVLLHAANAFLVYRLARVRLNNTSAAVLAGLLFAVHPISTESVDMVSARNTLLSAFCVLSAYLLHRRSVLQNKMSGAFTGAGMFLAGLFSKESTLMIAPFIAALEIPVWRENAPGARRRAALRLLPYALGTACYLVMRWLTLSRLGIQTGIIPGFGISNVETIYVIPGMATRLRDNLYIIPSYALSLLRPTALNPRYAVPDDLHHLILPLTAAWVCILALLAWLLRGRSRTTLFGLVWLVVFWLPVSGIFWLASAPLADRFLYIPVIGIWLVVADQAVLRFSSRKPAQQAFLAASVLILVALSLLTINRNRDWANNTALFSRVVEQYPDNPFGHAGLGEAYLNRNRGDVGDLSLAERELGEALDLYPLLPGVHAKLGFIRLAREDSEGAVYYYTKALGMNPLDKEALLNRGIAWENLGNNLEALSDFKRFLAIPGYELSDARPYAETRVRELSRLLRM